MPEHASPPEPGDLAFLVHDEGDDVAVAVRDTEPGSAGGAFLKTGKRFVVDVTEAVPLGHKVALRSLAENEAVTEYGVPIGVTRSAVAAGTLVHTHNLRSARWHNSV